MSSSNPCDRLDFSLIVFGLLVAACGSGVGATFDAGGLTKEPCPDGVSSELRCYVVTAKNVGGESCGVTGWVSMYKKAGGATLIEGDKTQSEEVAPGNTIKLHLTAPPKPRGYAVTYGYAPSQSS